MMYFIYSAYVFTIMYCLQCRYL